MKLNRKRLIIVVLLVAAVLSIAALALVIIKDRTYFHSPSYSPDKSIETDILVVYYSRSGNTEAMAREIARKMKADIIKIESESYGLDFKGWFDAANDARRKNETEIIPEVVDLTPYRLIFLGSPVWLFRPAPPLWTFVDKNDFKNKNVILFNTFNSRFKDEEIEEFQKRVENKGGRFVDHVYIRRGRVYNQKSGMELILEAQSLLEAKVPEWLEIDK
ncbi:MAG: flavodoxin/nitric oxide synthase [candidate division Zixibacteria bacterium]|nr:flavodoxin/nitric oxide synthase [candidate division Zixibacteria bacterium]